MSCGLAPIGFRWVGATDFSKVSPEGEEGADEADDETLDFAPTTGISLTVELSIGSVDVTVTELFSQTPLFSVLLMKEVSLLLLKAMKLFNLSLALLPRVLMVLVVVGSLAITLAGLVVAVLVDKLLVFDRICSIETMAPLDSMLVGGKQLLFGSRADGLGFRSERMVRSVKAAAAAAADDDDEVFVRLLLPPMHIPLGLLF